MPRIPLILTIGWLTRSEPAVFLGADTRRIPMHSFRSRVQVDFTGLVIRPERDSTDNRIFFGRLGPALGRIKFPARVQRSSRSIRQQINPAHRHRQPLGIGFSSGRGDHPTHRTTVITESFHRILLLSAHRPWIDDRENKQRLVQIVGVSRAGRDRRGIHVDPLIRLRIPIIANILGAGPGERIRRHVAGRIQFDDAAQLTVVAINTNTAGLARPRQKAAVRIHLGSPLPDLRNSHVDGRIRQRARFQVFRIFNGGRQLIPRHGEERGDEHRHEQDDGQHCDQGHALLLRGGAPPVRPAMK